MEDYDLDFPTNLLLELKFKSTFLTDEQDERLYIVLDDSMPYERDAFDAYYVQHVSIKTIAKREGRNPAQILSWIEKINANVAQKKHYILTGEY